MGFLKQILKAKTVTDSVLIAFVIGAVGYLIYAITLLIKAPPGAIYLGVIERGMWYAFIGIVLYSIILLVHFYNRRR